MSAREFEFAVDHIPITIYVSGKELKAKGRSMTWRQAETFVDEGKEMLARPEAPPPTEWLQRTRRVVADSLQRAGFQIQAEELIDQFDIPTINGMADQVLRMSGLQFPTNGASGEKSAAPISNDSAAA